MFIVFSGELRCYSFTTHEDKVMLSCSDGHLFCYDYKLKKSKTKVANFVSTFLFYNSFQLISKVDPFIWVTHYIMII